MVASIGLDLGKDREVIGGQRGERRLPALRKLHAHVGTGEDVVEAEEWPPCGKAPWMRKTARREDVAERLPQDLE